MSSAEKEWQNLDITREEFDRVSEAFKDDKFKQMFFDYCQEIQDPENKKIYEAELTQFEAERGVDVTFLHPEPGFVVKTSVDGKSKGFINIAQCDEVDKPKNEVRHNNETGKSGLSWSIPYAQAPPRFDVDNKGARCVVYDVLFHPDALRLAKNNSSFKKHLIETACDAIEREFKVQLDRTNLKFPKLKFKGLSRSTIIRKRSEVPPEPREASPIDAYYPPMPSEEKSEPKIYETKIKNVEKYTIPKYIIKHRRGVDFTEMTFELDAKLNVTVPKELVIEIELPMLMSTKECNLDVTERKLYLISEKPAKYKLSIDLPFPVNDQEGSAKFDSSKKKLTVVLPVSIDAQRNYKDLYREDSGVESDIKDEHLTSPTSESEIPPVIEVIYYDDYKKEMALLEEEPNVNNDTSSFLKENIKYNFPSHFDCNTLDDNLAFTLHVKNVDPQSVQQINGPKFAHITFTSIGSGCYPVHYSFYISFQPESLTEIVSAETETWDNNVILTIALKNYEDLKHYLAGHDDDDLKQYEITELFAITPKKFSCLQEREEIDVSVTSSCPEEVRIDIQSTKSENFSSDGNFDTINKDGKKSTNTKKQKKKNKKRRSLSESSCDDFKNSTDIEELSKSNAAESDDPSAGRKSRSHSESRDNINERSAPKDFKGILKHPSRYCRSMSESCSSIDERMSLSCDLADTFCEIPEEENPNQGLSESCKKTVRFSDVIRKQLFRLDSSILGQRKKNQKRKSQKQRALQRRNSEGDSADYEDNKSPRTQSLLEKKSKKYAHHDSGLDLSDVGNSIDKVDNNDTTCYRADSESSETEAKNSLMFDLEM